MRSTQGCQRYFEILGSLSAPTYFSLCTAAQICKWLSSECRAPDQLQFIPFCSPPLAALTLPLCSFLLSRSLPPLPSSPPPPPLPLTAVFYLVLAALFLAHAPLRACTGEGISLEHLQDDSLATSSILSVLYKVHQYSFQVSALVLRGGELFILCSHDSVALPSLMFNYQ